MKILDFDLEGSHFIIEADISPRQEADDMECQWLRYDFDNTQVDKETDGERTIPYFIFHGGDIAKLAYATNEFLYYEDSNYMPLMFRTVDGTLVSDNEFADMGLYESEENVENGTEHILPFTDYGSDVESACDLEDEEDLEI